MHGGMLPLMWAFEIENAHWEVPLWIGPYSDRDDAEDQGKALAFAIARANRTLGDDRKYDHFKIVLRQVNWPTCWPLEPDTFIPVDDFHSRFLQETLAEIR